MNNSSRQCFRRGVFALFFALIIGNFAVWANSETETIRAAAPVSFASRTRVMLFASSIGQWWLAEFGQASLGNEFYFNSRLYRVVDPSKAQVVLDVDTGKLFEADRPYDKTSRRPGAGDVVQVLDKDMRPASHALLSMVQPGAAICFQGKGYDVKTDRSLADSGLARSAASYALQRIDITQSAMRHITDRHTVGGTQNAGTSIFNPSEDIQALIKNAQLAARVPEPNGYFKRVFDAGRNIGTNGAKGKQISTYRVITTQSGKLVTAYPAVD